MNSHPECDRARLALMAWLDGETGGRSPSDDPHLAVCGSCQSWLAELQRTTARFEGIEYPRRQVDLWPGVAGRLRPRAQPQALPASIWLIVPVALVWRALQLSVDLPWPLVNSIVPLTVILVMLSRLSVNPLAIATSAPELEKRGI